MCCRGFLHHPCLLHAQPVTVSFTDGIPGVKNMSLNNSQNQDVHAPHHRGQERGRVEGVGGVPLQYFDPGGGVPYQKIASEGRMDLSCSIRRLLPWL